MLELRQVLSQYVFPILPLRRDIKVVDQETHKSFEGHAARRMFALLFGLFEHFANASETAYKLGGNNGFEAGHAAGLVLGREEDRRENPYREPYPADTLEDAVLEHATYCDIAYDEENKTWWQDTGGGTGPNILDKWEVITYMAETTGVDRCDHDGITCLPDRGTPEYLRMLADILNELGDDGDVYLKEAITTSR